jgi:subtilisin family serine protease
LSDRRLLLSALVLVGLGPFGFSGRAGSVGPPERLLVAYSGSGVALAPSLEQRLGASRVAAIPQLGVNVLEVPPNRLESTLQALRSDPIVRYAERDRVVEALQVPNDPFWPTQWSPRTTDAVRAWDLTTGSPQVVIAIVDTGIDPAQPDLQGKLVPGYDYVNSDSDPSDDNGHGTAVAGVVAAGSNNGIGVAGYCWHCRLMPVKVLGADGTGLTSTLAQGIVWATDHGARVINASLGSATENMTVSAAAHYAVLHGVLVVAAAGNDSSSTLNYPAALPGVLSVAASDERDRLYAFSNSAADLAAPGENSTTSRGGGYERFLGTSSAAPVVSGVAALLFSAVPEASPAEVTKTLEESAQPIPGVVYGRVRAYTALVALAPSLVPPSQAGAAVPLPRSSTVVSRTFVGRTNRGMRGFRIATGRGVLRARLVVLGAPRPVRLQLLRGGRSIASVQGRGPLRLRATVRRATYRLVVRAAARSTFSFRLRVTYPRAS